MAIYDKKGFVLKDLIIGFVIFSAIIGLFYLMVVDMGVTYNNTGIINEHFNDNYNKLNDLNQFTINFYDLA